MYRNSETFNAGETINKTPVDDVRRDHYDAITNTPREVWQMIFAVQQAAGWETGFTEINRRGGFESRNIDVYGYDVTRDLAVVQIRRARRRNADSYTRVSKLYCLIGRDEGQLFSHPLPSSPRRNPNLWDMSPEDIVTWAESKIFGVPVDKLHTVIRQGDVALVPVRGIPHDAEPLPTGVFGHVIREDGVHTLVLRDSHNVEIDGEVYRGRYVFIDGAVEVNHAKNEHRAIAAQGKFKIVVGARADVPSWIDSELGD